jgi:hypothetical protein
MFEFMRIKTNQTINYNPTIVDIYRKTETKTDSGGIDENYSLLVTGEKIKLYNKKTELINNETGEKKVYTVKALCNYDIDIKEEDKLITENNREYKVKIITPFSFQREIIKYELVLEEL